MKCTHFLAPLAAALLLAAPGIADAQKSIGDIGGDIGKAASDIGSAASDIGEAAAELDRLGVDVEGIEAPAGTKATYECSKYQRIVINFKKAENKVLGTKKTPLLISAHGHCNVVLRNVTLRGKAVLDLSGHANVLLHNVTVEGGKRAIEISGHANVKLRNSRVMASKKAMRISGHANVRIESSKLKGKSSVSGFALVSYDNKSKVGKLRKSGRYSTIRRP